MKNKLTEREINIRVKCGCYCTDICELTLCIMAWLYDLKSLKEEQGQYKQKVKQLTERSINIVNLTCERIKSLYQFYNTKFERSWVQVYEEIINGVDESVQLQGEERYVSLVDTAFRLIEDRVKKIRNYSFTFAGIHEIMRVLDAHKWMQLAYSSVTLYDLTYFIEKQIDKAITTHEKEIARKKLEMGTNEYYNRVYCKTSSKDKDIKGQTALSCNVQKTLMRWQNNMGLSIANNIGLTIQIQPKL